MKLGHTWQGQRAFVLLVASVCSACPQGSSEPRDAALNPIDRDGGKAPPYRDAGADSSTGGPGDMAPEPQLCDGAARGTVCAPGKHCLDGSCTANVCGDGIGAGLEECDDGNLGAGDGCSAACKLEPCPDGSSEVCEGGISIDVAFNQCPRIVSYTAAPSQADVGKRIELFSNAEDADSDAFAFEWKAKDGDFGNPSAPNTTYLCSSVGSKLLELTVRDRDGCEDSAKIRVTCIDVGASVRGGVR